MDPASILRLMHNTDQQGSAVEEKNMIFLNVLLAVYIPHLRGFILHKLKSDF